MPRLAPIRAVRYAAPPDGDLSELIAPPYDVLDEQPKQQLLRRNPRNIVAIDLPVTPPKTVGPDAAYDQAGRTYRQWLDEGVLQRSDAPCVIAYEQRYTLDGQSHGRRGLIAGLGIEPFGRIGGGIHRHEKTIKAGTDDRLKLMQATAAQLSPIFGVYDDPQRRTAALLEPWFDRTKPDFYGLTEADNTEHRCWIIDDAGTIQTLAAHLAPIDVVIADGHHRYTTAMHYAEHRPDQPAAGLCLFVLVPLQDEGMVVLPTHRVLRGLGDFSIDRLQEILDADGRFALQQTYHAGDGLPHMVGELPSFGHHAFGLYDPRTGHTFAVTSHEEDPLFNVTPDKPASWRSLDVAIFHHGFVEGLLQPNFATDAVQYSYPHDLTTLMRQCHEGEDRLGVIMQATPLEAVCDVARDGEVMPPKSTYFYPKMATGLAINPLD